MGGPGGKGGMHGVVRRLGGMAVWQFGGLKRGGGTWACDCYCTWGMQFCAKLRTLSFALRMIMSSPALSSAFLLEFVGIKSALSLPKKDLK